MGRSWERRIWGFIAFLAILFLGCEEEIQEFEPEPNICAVMRLELSASRWQEIRIDTTYSIQDSLPPNYLDYFEGVEGAEAFIYSAQDTLVFEESPYNPGLYMAYSGFNDSTLYHLEVRLPWGDTVIGQAYMPTYVQISWPKSRDTIALAEELRDSNLVCWNKCQHVKRYMVQLISEGEGYVTDYYYFTDDTSCAFFAENASKIPTCEFPLYLHLVVIGLSQEYEDYWDPRSYGRSNLSCRYGVFGGIAVAEVEVYIVE